MREYSYDVPFFLRIPKSLFVPRMLTSPSRVLLLHPPPLFRDLPLSGKRLEKVLQGPTNEELGHITGIDTSTGGFPHLGGVLLRPNGIGPVRLGDCQIKDGRAEWYAAVRVINAYAALNGKKMHMDSGDRVPFG